MYTASQRRTTYGIPRHPTELPKNIPPNAHYCCVPDVFHGILPTSHAIPPPLQIVKIAFTPLWAHVQRQNKVYLVSALILSWCEHAAHGNASNARVLQVLALDFQRQNRRQLFWQRECRRSRMLQFLSFFFFFFHPFIIIALLSRSLPVVAQIRGHIAGPPPPSPLIRAFILSGEEFSIFFPRRLASKCAYARC